MELTDIWDQFAERMFDIEIMQRSIKTSAESELAELSKQDPEKYKSGHKMLFRDIRSGEYQTYKLRNLSLESTIREVFLKKNRQYQWLLAEAYEEFEDYVRDLYAYCGFSNPDFWPLKEYGNIKLSEVATKDYAWHQNQAPRNHKSILNSFRNAFPALREVENSNEIRSNMKFSILLVEKLRHIIVHKAGRTSDREAFIREVAEDAGVSNNGNVSSTYADEASHFFGEDKFSNLVVLLEIPVDPILPGIEQYHCRFGDLHKLLLGYAHLLHEMIEQTIRRLEP